MLNGSHKSKQRSTTVGVRQLRLALRIHPHVCAPGRKCKSFTHKQVLIFRHTCCGQILGRSENTLDSAGTAAMLKSHHACVHEITPPKPRAPVKHALSRGMQLQQPRECAPAGRAPPTAPAAPWHQPEQSIHTYCNYNSIHRQLLTRPISIMASLTDEQQGTYPETRGAARGVPTGLYARLLPAHDAVVALHTANQLRGCQIWTTVGHS